jgi:hypothetical protein
LDRRRRRQCLLLAKRRPSGRHANLAEGCSRLLPREASGRAARSANSSEKWPEMNKEGHQKRNFEFAVEPDLRQRPAPFAAPPRPAGSGTGGSTSTRRSRRTGTNHPSADDACTHTIRGWLTNTPAHSDQCMQSSGVSRMPARNRSSRANLDALNQRTDDAWPVLLRHGTLLKIRIVSLDGEIAALSRPISPSDQLAARW